MHDPTVLQPPRGAAGATVVLLCICAVLAAVGVAVSFGVLGIVDAAEMGKEVTEEQWRATMGMFGLQTLAFLGAYILTGICFMFWQYGTVKFARAVAPEANTTGPGWATWSFIIPVVNLFMPVRATYAAYTSCHAKEFEARTGRPAPATGGLVAMWWGGWIITLLLRSASENVGEMDPFVEGVTAEAVRSFWYTHAGSYAATFVTAIVAIVMIVKLTKVQSRLVSVVVEEEPEALPPAIMRAALPGAAGGQVEQEPPLIPAQPAQRATAAPTLSGGLPGMPPAPATAEEDVVRRARLPKDGEEAPRHYMPGIPPPPESEAA